VQERALLIESIIIVVLWGVVVWHRYQRTFKRWWKNWRARPKRPWNLRPRG
jgi:hypothetical protein